MSWREIQSARLLQICDECGLEIESQSRPDGWAAVQTTGWADTCPGTTHYLDLCNTCRRGTKYFWILDSEPAVIPPMAPIGG
jgi:hypothetical protein